MVAVDIWMTLPMTWEIFTFTDGSIPRNTYAGICGNIYHVIMLMSEVHAVANLQHRIMAL